MVYNNFGNFVLFQVSWFATAYSAAQQWSLLATLSVQTGIGLHLVLSADYRKELGVLVCAGILGLMVDSLNLMFNVFFISDSKIAPLWLVGLWMLFACTINHSLRWMNDRLLLAAMSSSLAGPVAYYAGDSLGALNLNSDWGLLILAFQWVWVLPVLLVIARSLNKSFESE